MKSHIAEISSIAHHLGEIGLPVAEEQLCTKIISILPSEYHGFKTAWHNSNQEKQTLLSLTSKLLQEERELAKWKPKTTDHELALQAQPSTSSTRNGRHQETRHTQSRTSSTARRGHREERSRSNGSGRPKQPHDNKGKDPQECSYCGLDNHTVDRCHTKRRHERTDEEREELAKRRRKDHGQMAMDTMVDEATREIQDFSLVSTSPRYDTRSTGDWFADSGATQHMSDQKEWLQNFVPVPEGSWSVNGIGSSSYPVRGYGDAHVWTTTDNQKKPATIKKVLYVPGLGTNLFSIAAVTDLGWKATFTGTRVLFTTDQGDTIMAGERVGRTLYLLDVRPRSHQGDQQSLAFASSISPGLATWHRRLAHISPKTIIKMASSGVVKGLDLANNDIPSEPCAGCQYGKHQRSPFPVGRKRAIYSGQLIHSDICGPMEKATPGGALYFVLFIDDFSGMRFIYLLRKKSEAAEKFMELIHAIRGQTGNLVRTLRTDNGGEYCSNEFEAWLGRKGIQHETSAPYTPQQDGVSERGIRTVTEGARSCLHDCQPPSEPWGEAVTIGTGNLIRESRLPISLWGEAAKCTVYTLNRVLNKTSPVTPYQRWHNSPPDVSNLRAFGSIAYIHVPDAMRQKWARKSTRCIFTGYCETTKGWRFWDPASRTMKTSRDATFDEHHRLVDVPEDHPNEAPPHRQQVPPTQARGEPQLVPELHSTPKTDQPEDVRDQRETAETHRQPSPSTQPRTIDLAEEHQEEQENQPRRSLRGRIPRREWKAYPAKDRPHAGGFYVPDTYTAAISCPEADEWRAAIKEEYHSLMENRTWSLVECPKGRTPIKSRWTFDIKPGMNGEPRRFKARFVAKGFSQRPGFDFSETYASVVTHDTLRLMMSIVAKEDLEVAQMDIKTAFLYGKLSEEIYMVQPEGFVTPGQESKVCRLHKCLYGLKQASRVWGEHFTDFIKQQGFTQSEADPCFFFRTNETDRTFLVIWVDDGIVASTNKQNIGDFLTALGDTFQIRSYPLERFVGITITRDRKRRMIHLAQPDYIAHVIEKFQMTSCYPKPVPADPGTHLTKLAEGSTTDTSFPYREAVGCLLYLALVSRPDISFSVGQVARFIESHNTSHIKAVRRIISYLCGTQSHGICFTESLEKSVIGYCDADYAGCTDTRKSTTGSVFLLHGGPIAWCSRRQSCIATSTTEAEYVAASETAKEAVWIRRILPDFQQGQGEPITIKCDNKSAIQLTRHPDQRQKTKHIDIRYTSFASNKKLARSTSSMSTRPTNWPKS